MTKTTSFPDNQNFIQTLFFRLFFCYYILYAFPFPLEYIPFGHYFGMWTYDFWKWLVPIVAENIFHIDKELTLPNGSGDTTFNYIQVFTQLLIAILATTIWTLSSNKRKTHSKLYIYLIVYLRYYLAFYMLSYGSSKLFVNQFSSLSLFDLITPYGDSSPMGLMWNFMEYSDSYTIFSGVSEIIGGLLLMFRRTTKLGALVTFGVMLNVFMMNLSYDIPVKLFSSHLMIIALFILSPHLKSLTNFFILNKPAMPVSIDKYFVKRKLNIAGLIFKTIFILFLLITFTTNQIRRHNINRDIASYPELYGIYTINSFSKNGKEIIPLATDSLHWKKMVVDKYSTAIIKLDDSKEYYKNETDTTSRNLKLTLYRDSLSVYNLKYQKSDSILNLEGTYLQDTLKIELTKKDHTQFRLLKRGFNWINEYPYNR
ncbi:DoxX family membrane protein [Zhouia spongiae]|uniref:DoxX family membrane protein n=1 Tax=Zhouia spongiae TaxID=2202721 RepID=A0ABY3YRK8_9FLAO|nr:DoxX family membrane protein [Zhouia spongiae]UNZ00180.1 DoxX family membrane protein [Zhouia spongiae]